MRGAPADGGAILQLFGREVAMCLDDEARGTLERVVCGIAWVCMGFGFVGLGWGRESSEGVELQHPYFSKKIGNYFNIVDCP